MAGFTASGGWLERAEAQTSFRSLLSEFSRYDRDGDGADEIDFMIPMSFEETYRPVRAQQRLIVVFVERRLLDEIPGGPYDTTDLVDRLARLKRDLAAEGFESRFVITEVYDSSDGPRHQDGLTLLAMRDFLSEVRKLDPRLAGTLLIGSFPEATLVRRWIWNRQGAVTIKGREYRGNYLRIVPEVYAHRSDIVLGDLDGAWDEIYRRGSVRVESIEAKPSESGWWRDGTLVIPSNRYEKKDVTFEDFFWINDSRYGRYVDSSRQLVLTMRRQPRNPEIAPEDASQDNPIARPEIAVARINPRNIAVMPDPDLLNSAGEPRTVHVSADRGRPSLDRARDPMNWARDAGLERRLLVEFLDRNHRFRLGTDAGLPFRAGAIGYPTSDFELDGFATWADSAKPSFDDPKNGPSDATLADYVEWLTEPVTLRTVVTHSGARRSSFGDGSAYELEAVTGTPWRWEWNEDGTTLSPTFRQQGGAADLSLYRTVWENGVLAAAGPSFILPTGCEVNSPFSGHLIPYDAQNFGQGQNAEAQLFYLNGLAMVARAKVFYDRPLEDGLARALGSERATFGALWLETHAADARDAGLSRDPSSTKKAYTWSVLGDWTLRLRYRNGFGVMSERGWAVENTHTQIDDAWIGRWNFDSDRDEFRASGDFDGDGTDEIVVTSPWGIGILELEDGRWGSPVVAPNGSRFGDWTFDSGTQEIVGVGDLDGRGGDEILVTGPAGLAVLARTGSRLTSLTVVPDNTRLGAWRYVSHNTIEAIADLNGDDRDDIVVSSGWGIGVLTLEGASLRSIVTRPNGTNFGGWPYDSRTDRIDGVVELDGRAGRELIVRNARSIGVLRQVGDGFATSYQATQDTWMGGWKYRSTDSIEAIVDVDGDDRHELIVTSPWGLGVLDWNGTRLASSFVAKNGTWLGSWLLDTATDRFVAFGDFRGGGASDLVVGDDRRIATLHWSMGRLVARRGSAHGRSLGDWLLLRTDRAVGIGDFDPESPGLEWLVAH